MVLDLLNRRVLLTRTFRGRNVFLLFPSANRMTLNRPQVYKRITLEFIYSDLGAKRKEMAVLKKKLKTLMI